MRCDGDLHETSFYSGFPGSIDVNMKSLSRRDLVFLSFQAAEQHFCLAQYPRLCFGPVFHNRVMCRSSPACQVAQQMPAALLQRNIEAQRLYICFVLNAEHYFCSHMYRAMK